VHQALLCVTLFATVTVATAMTAMQSPSGATRPTAAASGATSADTLDRLLSPIALYPDQLLAQILLCAANPGKVGALHEWLASHSTEKGSALQDAATRAGFDAAFVALVLFPDVVSMMAERLDWTAQLGSAFAADRSAVFGSIQRLRSKAVSAGKLKDTAQQDVETKTTTSGQQVIVIEPANPQVVYVPQYNPQTVYTQSTSTTIVQESSSADAVAAGLIGFTAGIAIGAAFDNDYYYGPYGWGRPVHMYNDAWDDWYDHREDAREDWMDHREDLSEDRSDRARNAQEERSDRARTTQEARTERQQTERQPTDRQQTDRQQTRQERPESGAQRAERSGTRSDAFSGYSSGKSERAASQRGERSRSSARSSGGRRR
jgi:hypothetical protein